MKNLLKQIILEQQEYIQGQNNIPRKINSEWLTTSEIVIISGVRRCGKSVLLQQIREQMQEQSYFINFDDDRLINFKLEHFNLLEEAFIELFDKQSTYYFDEIQNIEGWERFVRRLYNAGNKIFITGSNAKMLSRELGTHLTGRYIQIDLYPFSFKEYLNFNNYTPTEKELYTTLGQAYKKYPLGLLVFEADLEATYFYNI
jgi:predicted AAA+ superfamily ATPase